MVAQSSVGEPARRLHRMRRGSGNPGGLRGPVALAALLVALASRAGGAAESDAARHFLHADVLAPALGREMIGASYERVVRGGGHSFVIGAGAGRGLKLDTTGFEVEEIELDVVGGGLQLRFYGRGGPTGFFGTVGASYVHGSGTGIDAGGGTRSYRLDGLETSLLGVGYQAILLRHLALDVSVSLRQLAAYLRSRSGADAGRVGRFAGALAGGIGVAF